LINVVGGHLGLWVISPSGRSMCVLISDDTTLLDTLDANYRDGVVWITVPVAREAVGPIPLPKYLGHQIAFRAVNELTVLASKRGDRTKLPPCRPENDPIISSGGHRHSDHNTEMTSR
ncbi:MAG: hypothetical protein ACRC7G_07410, partial [Beijerinckiaceae bacterium]